jgi:hypothetical protein
LGSLFSTAQAVKKVLDRTRNPVYPTESSHTYTDKYLLAELATKTAITAVVASFEAALPRWTEHTPAMQAWVGQDKTVTLRMDGAVECAFVKTVDRQVESATKVVEIKGSKEKTTKVVTTITEHFWSVSTGWEISAYGGADPNNKVVLATGQGAHPCVTRGDKVNKPHPPRPAVQPLATSECEISWLLKCLSGVDGQAEFVIDRMAASCHTPRRNKEVDTALSRLELIGTFATHAAASNFHRTLFGVVEREHNQIQSGSTGSNQAIFSPVVAMFSLESAEGEDVGVTLSSGDLATFFAEHNRSILEQKEVIAALCPAGTTAGSIITPVAAGIFALFNHIGHLTFDHECSVGVLETMLRTQLISAIGKEVQPSDFAEYMDFHNRKLFAAEHAPQRFCYAIRRPERYPDGTLSIETTGSGTNQPLLTSVVHTKATRPMKFALSAAAEVKFMGDRYIHAAIMHSFSGQGAPSLKLVARARQFSSFVLLAGKILSADQFEPTAAMIVQNMDDLTIPLLLETIPTPKEFKDAIESLSPEQQRFAKAYRSLQLSSTLFGVCIIQIKPQLERVLNLKQGSLTKEIQLTQDLMELFIKYQVPSDLLSFDGAEDADVALKVPAVTEHVSQIKAVIQSQRDAELVAVAEEATKKLLESIAVEEEAAKKLLESIERSGDGARDVFEALDEEDAKKHPRKWDTADVRDAFVTTLMTMNSATALMTSHNTLRLYVMLLSINCRDSAVTNRLCCERTPMLMRTSDIKRHATFY